MQSVFWIHVVNETHSKTKSVFFSAPCTIITRTVVSKYSQSGRYWPITLDKIGFQRIQILDFFFREKVTSLKFLL